jgi:hypothetical protein
LGVNQILPKRSDFLMLRSPKFYKYLGFALFICSAIVTMQFMWSSALGIVALVIASIQGTAIESCKCGFTYIAISIENVGWRIFFGTLALIAFVFSVIFTFGYSTNMNNRIKNETMYSSDEYSKKQDNIQRQKDLYEQTKKDLEDLKGQRDIQVSGMEKTRDSWPVKGYGGQRSLEQDKINKAAADYKTRLEAKQAELNKIADSLNGVKFEELPEDGYITMYQLFAKAVNAIGTRTKGKVEQKPWTAEDIEFWFQIIISLFLEFAGIGCLIYSQHLNADGKPIPSIKPVINTSGIGFKPQIVADSVKNSNDIQGIIQNDIQLKRTIGFQAPALSSVTASTIPEQNTEQTKNLESLVTPNFYNDIGIDKEDLKKYIEHVYSSAKYLNSGESPGYNTIGQNTGIGVENARKIKAHLERLGIVKTVGTKTFVLMDSQACKTKIQA